MSKYNWHQRVVHFPTVQITNHIPRHEKCSDFCSYTRWFLWKLLVVIPMFCVGMGTYLGCYIEGWFSFFMVNGGSIDKLFMDNHVAWTVTHGIGILLVSLVLGAYLLDKRAERARAKRKQEYDEWVASGSEGHSPDAPKPDGFLKTWYLKWKHKYCPKMDY